MSFENIPQMSYRIPENLLWKGPFVDNQRLSNLVLCKSPIRFRDAEYQNVEAAYVASKNPDVLITVPQNEENGGQEIPFYKYIEQWCKKNGAGRVKQLGKPKSRGGLIDVSPKFETYCMGAMIDFTAQKFSQESDKKWLLEKNPEELVEFNNWGDKRWGAAFKKGETHAVGINALGEILFIHQAKIERGQELPQNCEDRWKDLQEQFTKYLCRQREKTQERTVPKHTRQLTKKFNIQEY